MKLEAQFTVRQNTLLSLDGTEFRFAKKTLPAKECVLAGEEIASSLGGNGLLCVSLAWQDVGLDEESYDEAFLASLRDFLKSLESDRHFAVIVPLAPETALTKEESERYVSSMKHCARRIKDASSVVGFALPCGIDPALFRSELSAKHSHYIYFSSDEKLLSDSSVVRL